MAQETNDTILWIPAASMAGITTAAAAIGSRQTGGPATPGDYRMVRGTLHTGTASIAVAAALTSGQWNVIPGANEGELDFSFSEYGALNGGNPVKWQYSVNDGADWADVTGSEAADGALGTYTVSGLTGGTAYTASIRVRMVTNVGDGAQSADAKSATVTGAGSSALFDDPFDSDAGWDNVPNATYTISGGTLNKAVGASAGPIRDVTAELTPAVGQQIKIINDITAHNVGGSCRIRITGATLITTEHQNGTGHFEEEFTCPELHGTTNDLRIFVLASGTDVTWSVAGIRIELV